MTKNNTFYISGKIKLSLNDLLTFLAPPLFFFQALMEVAEESSFYNWLLLEPGRFGDMSIFFPESWLENVFFLHKNCPTYFFHPLIYEFSRIWGVLGVFGFKKNETTMKQTNTGRVGWGCSVEMIGDGRLNLHKAGAGGFEELQANGREVLWLVLPI